MFFCIKVFAFLVTQFVFCFFTSVIHIFYLPKCVIFDIDYCDLRFIIIIIISCVRSPETIQEASDVNFDVTEDFLRINWFCFAIRIWFVNKEKKGNKSKLKTKLKTLSLCMFKHKKSSYIEFIVLCVDCIRTLRKLTRACMGLRHVRGKNCCNLLKAITNSFNALH